MASWEESVSLVNVSPRNAGEMRWNDAGLYLFAARNFCVSKIAIVTMITQHVEKNKRKNLGGLEVLTGASSLRRDCPGGCQGELAPHLRTSIGFPVSSFGKNTIHLLQMKVLQRIGFARISERKAG